MTRLRFPEPVILTENFLSFVGLHHVNSGMVPCIRPGPVPSKKSFPLMLLILNKSSVNGTKLCCTYRLLINQLSPLVNTKDLWLDSWWGHWMFEIRFRLLVSHFGGHFLPTERNGKYSLVFLTQRTSTCLQENTNYHHLDYVGMYMSIPYPKGWLATKI